MLRLREKKKNQIVSQLYLYTTMVSHFLNKWESNLVF